jgi:hypothetical protein
MACRVTSDHAVIVIEQMFDSFDGREQVRWQIDQRSSGLKQHGIRSLDATESQQAATTVMR